MQTFVFRLIPPRPDFAMTMSDTEEEAMTAHVEYWKPRLEAGEVKVFGPVMEPDGVWGLAVFEAESEEAAGELAANDPSVLAGVNSYALGAMMGTTAP
jgi:uncharacterized protein YciI